MTDEEKEQAKAKIKAAEKALIEAIEANGGNARSTNIAINHIQTGGMWGVRALYYND